MLYMRRLVHAILMFAIVALPILSACSGTDRASLELEVYYYAFDGIVKKPDFRRALLRIETDRRSDFQHGDSVMVILHRDHGQFLLKRVVRPGNISISGNEYFLHGVFEGWDDEAKQGLIGFVFGVTRSEYAATEMVANTTKFIKAQFTIREQNLQFELLEVVRQADKKPIMRK